MLEYLPSFISKLIDLSNISTWYITYNLYSTYLGMYINEKILILHFNDRNVKFLYLAKKKNISSLLIFN